MLVVKWCGNGDHRYSAAFAVADGFNPRSPKIAITRIEGVTRALVAPVTIGAGAIVAAGLAGGAVVIQRRRRTADIAA